MNNAHDNLTDDQQDYSSLDSHYTADPMTLDEGMRFIGSKEIAALMGCSIPVARQIMRRKDFPLVMCGKNLKVMKSEFIKWASQRRV